MDHFDLSTRLAHAAATIAALVAAVGASVGFYHMTYEVWLAALGGIGIASILGIGWWVLITAGARARRIGAQAQTIVLGALLVAIALGTSGWALATAIGGKQALADYQMRALVAYEAALIEAKGNVDAQADLVDTVRQHASATGLLGREEARTGEGPLFRSYVRTEQNLSNAADVMSQKLAQADGVYTAGQNSIAEANRNLGDAEAFRLSISAVGNAIRNLNDIDVRSDVLGIGMVGLNDRGLPELSNLTSDLRRASETAKFKPVEVPPYTSVSRAQATLSERPAGAWIVAFSIDTAPLIMLLMIMALIREPLLRETTRERKHVSDEQIRVSEENVRGQIRRVAE
ncbi:MAG: hypothetical protein ABJX32_04725 [Tateyamaria sp.]|uniref:hypothetical protein n=1 Tax=Tateyamaria sp. TaxID=1929288 RepID=UPI00329FF97A